MGVCGYTMFPATIRGDGGAVDGEEAAGVKDLICAAPDLQRIFTHVWVGGVRRVSKIEMISDTVNDTVESDVKLVRTFTYSFSSPFDLLSIADTIVAV